MTKQIGVKIGPRDMELLAAIARHPHTPSQLLDLSETFSNPFQTAHTLRRRLRVLSVAGFVKSFPFAVASDGRSPNYWKLTRNGFEILFGSDAALPRRRYFEAMNPGIHHHALCLGEAIVHIFRNAFKNEVDVVHFARENRFRLTSQPFVLYPDCGIVLRRPDGRRFSFMIELDNSTERVRTKMDVESIERKLRGYDAHQSKYSATDPDRYLVLFLTTRSSERLDHILELAAEVVSRPERTVFVGAYLSDFLASDPFTEPVLRDHRGLKRLAIPQPNQSSHQRLLPESLTAVAGQFAA